MEYRSLGNSGLTVSRYCFGSLTLGPLAAQLPPEQGQALLLSAFRRGVTFIDTAEQYQTYPYIRAALDAWPQRERIVVASKTYGQSDREAAWAIEDARLALNREVLDIFLLHELRDEADFAARAGAWRVLREAKANGVIRAVGISTHSAAIAAWAADRPDVDIIHPLLNQGGVGIRDGGLREMQAAVAQAHQAGKGVYGMKALGGGALLHTARPALTWAFDQEALDAVAVGCKDETELITNLGWLAGEEPPEARLVRKLERRLSFEKGPLCQGCGSCVRRCPNQALSIGPAGQAVWEQSRCIYCGYCIAACPLFCISFC